MNQWLAVVSITLLAVISPGPDFAMVSRNSLLRSRRAGVLTALGIGLGVWVHVAYTLLVVGVLLAQSMVWFNALKWVGAAYLIWLGVKMLRAKPAAVDCADAAEAQPAVAVSDGAALRTGFLTNALNPKTTVFVVSLFMQVVEPQTPLATQIAYGAFISSAHVLWFALVAWCFSAGSVRQRLLAVRHWIDRIFGGALVAFGLLLAQARLK